MGPEGYEDHPTQDAYVFERRVTFDDGAGKCSISRIDLYKCGCFVLESKCIHQVSSDVMTDLGKNLACS